VYLLEKSCVMSSLDQVPSQNIRLRLILHVNLLDTRYSDRDGFCGQNSDEVIL